MNTYLVTLADRETGSEQRILVQSLNDENMQEFVCSDAVRGTLQIKDPVVISVTLLRIRRPAPRTNLPSLTRG